MSETARLIGVGVGPGDPELLTLKATRALREADVVAHFAKAGNASRARTIAADHIRPDAVELPLLYPVTTEIPQGAPAYCDKIAAFYDDSAAAVAAHLDAHRSVAVICEGDPLFYGSYMHLHVRLASHYRTEVIAGVTGMSGCWSAIGAPIAQGNDVFTVLPGTLAEDELARRLADADAAAHDQKRYPLFVGRQGLLGLRSPHKADRKAQNRRRPGRARVHQLKKPE